MIISALCPELAGLHIAKIAVALALAGGVPRVDSRGTTLRGEAHVLLVGDAGTGKVSILKFEITLKLSNLYNVIENATVLY